MSFTIKISQSAVTGEGPATVVKLTGRLDSATSPGADQALAGVLTARVNILIFDLSGLDFISSAGLRVILGARKTVVGNGGKCILALPQPQIEKVLEIVKALPGMKLFRSEAEMDNYLAAIQKKVKEGE